MDINQIKSSLKNLSVLFVDDEEIVIDIMQDILPMLFKDSYYAKDGIEGIEQLKFAIFLPIERFNTRKEKVWEDSQRII